MPDAAFSDGQRDCADASKAIGYFSQKTSAVLIGKKCRYPMIDVDMAIWMSP
jgi:hypothetical protein